MTRVLEVRNLRAAYGATEVLHGIDLDVEAGQVTALLGANGSGKTTTLRAICQFQARTSGSILFKGAAIHERSTEQIAALGVGHVPDAARSWA
jgi:branched-chain amino acid transport system ATP-binding protein